MTAQTSLLEEIIVDNFAGGGGASTGIELATGRTVDIAINHDPDAILMHKTNHPYTQHYQESVWNIDPIEVCQGRPVGLAWFSPDCKHFSKAKGAKPVSKNVRGLAWIVLKWAGTVRPRVIILENVEEFKTWGPVRKGKPVKSKSGSTFDKWLSQLRDLGYEVDYRELVAADYGAPTIRKRFFLIARCDGCPIVWPEPTHNKKGTDGKLKWRSAAEIIDWTLPCPSIFDSKEQIKGKYGIKAIRPLASNTMQRIVRGMDKFVIKAAQPFIVQVNRGNNKVGASLIQYHSEQKSEYVRGQSLQDTLMTIDAAGRYGLSSAYLTECYGNGQDGINIDAPMHTITAKDRESLTMAHISKYYGNVDGSPAREPLSTVTAIDHNAVTATFISKFYKTGIGQTADDPLHTTTLSAGHFGQVNTHLVKHGGTQNLGYWPEVRKLLNTYCGYDIADDEILLLNIGGIDYFISDIGLRMLTPKELYAANGFPIDYIIDRDYTGKAYGKTKQVARCGNAVPPPFATAIVRANMPEWCDTDINTMQQLHDGIAV